MAFIFEKVKENIERASSEGFLEHPRRREFEKMANGALERCSYKAGWRWMYQDKIIKQRSLDSLANPLILADRDVDGKLITNILLAFASVVKLIQLFY